MDMDNQSRLPRFFSPPLAGRLEQLFWSFLHRHIIPCPFLECAVHSSSSLENAYLTSRITI